tara:strand:- start:163 stop:1074 length:912 start_codon:yes stop_codon:yes gene_type:complete
MRLFLLLLFVPNFVFCQEYDFEDDCEWNDDSTLLLKKGTKEKITGIVKSRIIDSSFEVNTESHNILEYERNYVNGTRDGIQKSFLNGKLFVFEIRDFSTNSRTITVYDEDGVTMTENFSYKDGKKHGLYKSYNQGKIEKEVMYNKGLYHGLSVHYRLNQIDSSTYNNDQLVYNKTCDLQKRKYCEGSFIPSDDGFDDRSGWWKYYYKSGELKLEIFYDKGGIGGIPQKVKYYHKNGNLKQIGQYNGERGLNLDIYNKEIESKNIIWEYTIEDKYELKKHGKWKLYDEKGELVKEENWKNGVIQ